MHLVYLSWTAFVTTFATMLATVLVTFGQSAAALPDGDFEPSPGGRGTRPSQYADPRGAPTAPTANPMNADDELKAARRIARNQRRSDIINQFMRKRNTPANVSAFVSSISLWNAPFESTIWSVYRGYEAGVRSMPFGGGNYYHGLTPNYIEFKLKDNQKVDDVAHCVLDFHTSRMNPERIFFRTRKCYEDTKLAHWADRRGFMFAGLVQVKNNRIEKFRDMTETDLLIDNRRLRVVFDDPNAFDPRAPGQSQQPPVDNGDPAPSSRRPRGPARGGGGGGGAMGNDDDGAGF